MRHGSLSAGSGCLGLRRRGVTSLVELRIENAALRRRHEAMRLLLEEGDREAMSLELWSIWKFKAAELEMRLDTMGTRLSLAERALRTNDPRDVAAWKQAVKDQEAAA